jgi:hypothetical protein
LGARAQKVCEYEVGGLDKRGREVLDILWKTHDYVIFQHAGGISPHFSDDDQLYREQAQRYLQLGPDLSRINALLPPPDKMDKIVQSGWAFFQTPDAFLYRETARAIANALTGNHKRAIDILAFVEARLIARRRAQGQFQYLLACMGTLAAIVFIALLLELMLWRSASSASPWPDLVRVATCGAAGGFLSVAIGVRKLDIDPDAQLWVYAYYGLIRLTIAIISAMVLYSLIKAGLVLQPMFAGETDRGMFALYAFATAAGFSETLIPNILRSAEDRVALPPTDAIEFTELADELKRRFSVPRAPTTSTSIPPALAEEIKAARHAASGQGRDLAGIAVLGHLAHGD